MLILVFLCLFLHIKEMKVMYNNYNYNPYYQPPRYQSMEQNTQQPILNNFNPSMQLAKTNNLLGKSVDSVEVVKAMDIPLDGSVSYFPLTDGSAIVTKQLQMDGTSKTIVYKPVEEEGKKIPKYVTFEELEKEISKIDFTEVETLKDELKEIKKQLKEMKKKGD